jgi:hypothetical protein
MQIIYYLLLFIGLAVFGYLLLKINDKISYGKAYKLLEKIDKELKVKQKALEKETIFYDEKYKQLLDILSNCAECDITKIPKNTKLIDIFCIKKDSVGEAKNINRLIYTTNTHYCLNGNWLYDDLDDLYQKYIEKNKHIDKKALNISILGELSDTKTTIDKILEMTIEEFLSKCFILTT